MDELQRRIAELVDRDAGADRDPAATMEGIRSLVHGGSPPAAPVRPQRKSPRLSEPWFC
jgi:hypothetical protein